MKKLKFVRKSGEVQSQENVCLLTTQSITKGSLDTTTVFIGEKLVLNGEFNNPMDKWFLYISHTHNFEPIILVKKCGLYTSFYGNPKNSTVDASAKVTVIQLKSQTIYNMKSVVMFILCNLFFLLSGVQ